MRFSVDESLDEDLGIVDEGDSGEGMDNYPDVGSDDGLFDEDFNDDFGFGGGSVSPMEKHNDLLKELTNFAPFLKGAVNDWLGVTWNEEKKQYTSNPAISPIMNIKGAAWCVGRLKTYARPNNIITDISSDDYKNLQEDMIDEFWINIGTRKDEFGICNDGDVIRVCNELYHAAILVLMGAGDGRYNKLLSTTVNRNENLSETSSSLPMPGMGMPVKKPGSLDKIKKFLVGS